MGMGGMGQVTAPVLGLCLQVTHVALDWLEHSAAVLSQGTGGPGMGGCQAWWSLGSTMR